MSESRCNNIIRQGAFDSSQKPLKGGLHCHTTLSDGKISPDETERIHAKNGYDFLAITDHRVYNRIDHAPDAGLVIIPGMEYDAKFFMDDLGRRTYHTVCLGPDDKTNGFAQGEIFESGDGKIKGQEDFQKYLDWIHSKNNITFLCHPEWSGTPSRYFDKLKGEFAIEVWNTGSALDHDTDTNAPYWDELLGLGHKIWGVAVDDGHNIKHHCKGWVMVNAEKTVRSILNALLEGKFYSSCGPEIKDFYVENGKAYIVTSPVSKVVFHSDAHSATKVSAPEGETITRAEIDLMKSRHLKGGYKFIRATVTDEKGNKAWTNPIFVDIKSTDKI